MNHVYVLGKSKAQCQHCEMPSRTLRVRIVDYHTALCYYCLNEWVMNESLSVTLMQLAITEFSIDRIRSGAKLQTDLKEDDVEAAMAQLMSLRVEATKDVDTWVTSLRD